jgi:glycosyltransferase involved in cell wall biosynthesis
MARIALVCEPPDGGVAEHVGQLAAGLRAHGHEPVVFDARGLPLVRDYAHPWLDARALGALTRALAGFDLVHAHAAKAGVIGRLAARACGLPAVYTPHCFPFVGEISGARRRFGLAVERALAPGTAAIVCVCEDEREVARAARVAPRRLEVIHNGAPACDAPYAGGLTVGSVCALRRQKRLDVLLAAAPRILDAVPGARVVIAGDGPEREALERAADPRVVFAPYRDGAQAHLRELAVYVLPSSWEAFPIGVLEAMACGVPQVATDVGGTREALAAGSGVLVAPRDPDALADAVIALLEDPARRERMSALGRAEHARRFTVERMVARTAVLYDELLRGPA